MRHNNRSQRRNMAYSALIVFAILHCLSLHIFFQKAWCKSQKKITLAISKCVAETVLSQFAYAQYSASRSSILKRLHDEDFVKSESPITDRP